MADIELLKQFEDAVKAEVEARFDRDAADLAYNKFMKKAGELELKINEAQAHWTTCEAVKSRIFDQLRTSQNN